MADAPPPIDVEVIPPDGPGGGPPEADSGTRTAFHPLAATLLLAVDNLWLLADWAVLTWIVTIPLSFLTVAVPTFVVQRRNNGDTVGRALLKAIFLGAVAAVPTSVTGTPVGLALLAWAGIRRMK